MKLLQTAGALALALLLSACAGSSTKPEVVQTLSPAQLATLHLKSVDVAAAPGVVMTTSDFERISVKVKNELNAADPGIMVNPASAEAAAASTMKLTFTQYDSGSAFARAMLIGLGQIHVEGDVVIQDPAGIVSGKYRIEKQFALGGIAGAVTSIQDVEDGFAKSVGEIVKKK